MLLKFFKRTGPGVIFFMIVALAAIWINTFINPKAPEPYIYESAPMPLYDLLQSAVGNNYLAGSIITFSLVCLMAFLVVNFNTTVFFINERTFLPAFIYIILSGYFPNLQCLNPVLFSTVFLMLAIMRIMDGYRKPGIAYNFFDAGIFIGIGSLFYANLIWFALIVLIGIMLLRAVNLLEILISVLGMVTPYLIVFGIYYVIGKDLYFLISVIQENLFGNTFSYEFDKLTIVALIFVSILTVTSIFYLFMLLNSKKIKSRKTYAIFLWVFFISIAAYIFVPSVTTEIAWIIIIPLCYFLTHYFIFVKKKIVAEVFFDSLMLIVILIQIFCR
jgi:hypothetical protein